MVVKVETNQQPTNTLDPSSCNNMGVENRIFTFHPTELFVT